MVAGALGAPGHPEEGAAEPAAWDAVVWGAGVHWGSAPQLPPLRVDGHLLVQLL